LGLLVWGEAANLRFCPEFLAYIYHLVSMTVMCLLPGNPLGKNITWLAIPSSSGSGGDGEEASPGKHLSMSLSLAPDGKGGGGTGTNDDHNTKGLILDNYLLDVIKPAYDMVAEGMREGYLNYDDFNELFWSPHCLDLKLPLTKKVLHNKMAITKGKTFVEPRSWMAPMLRTYWKVAVLQMVGLHFSFVLSYCTSSKDKGCTTAITRSPMITLTAAILLREVIDLALALPSFSWLYPTK